MARGKGGRPTAPVRPEKSGPVEARSSTGPPHRDRLFDADNIIIHRLSPRQDGQLRAGTVLGKNILRLGSLLLGDVLAVKEGDELYDKTSGNSIGKIVKVESVQNTEPILCNDGIYRIGTIQNRINLIITVMGEGTITEDGCFINRTYELVRESDRKFMTKYFEAQGKIKDFLS